MAAGRKRDLPGALGEALVVLIAVAVAFVAAFAGWAVGHATRQSRTVMPAHPAVPATTRVAPHVAAGAHIFVQFACAQCHGCRVAAASRRLCRL